MDAVDRIPAAARAARLADEAGRRSRTGVREPFERLRATLPAVLQTAAAAAAAWFVAVELVGHAMPFIAPVAAIIVLGQAYGQRGRRAAEIAVGVVRGAAVRMARE
jgi:hypothetical protein